MEVEFRSHKDDAWYNAYLILEHGGDPRLRIKFATFSDDHDEVVNASDLKSVQDINAFKSRVRKLSIQLQDTDCAQIHNGLPICAARYLEALGDRRYFDAVIDDVVRTEHKFVGEKNEECSCRFILEWKAGPDVGKLASVGVENICRVVKPSSDQDDQEISPALTSFLNAVLDSVGSNFSNSNSGVVCHSGTSKLAKAKRFKTSSANKVITPARSYVASWASKVRIGNPSKRDVHEMDDGGVPHVLILDNVEKGISSVTIMQFLYQQVSITCKAFVMPWKLSETYTRAIILDNEKNIAKLSKFLESPDHIVISSKGRPWAVSEKKLLDDTLLASIEKSQAIPQTALKSRTLTINELKVVSAGSHECKKAERLKNLYNKFADHQRRLHKTLLHEEEKIVQRPMRQIEEMDV